MVGVREGDPARDRERCIEIWLHALEARDGETPDRLVADRARSKFDEKIVRFAITKDPVAGFALTVECAPAEGSRAALLELLAIEPGESGNGFGRELLKDAVAASRAEGYSELLLDVREGNQRAISLYVSAGFEPTGKRHPHPLGGQPMVTYSLRL